MFRRSIEHEEYHFSIFRINFLIPMTPVSKTDKTGEEKENLYFSSIVIFLKSEDRFRGRFLRNFTHEKYQLDHNSSILQNGGMCLIDSLDRDNRTPLHYAAAKGSLEVGRKILV